jgi:glycosyltransferase involved in cell wall biosynthesis
VGVNTDLATTDDDGPGGRFQVPLGVRVTSDHQPWGSFYFRRQTEFYKCSFPFSRWAAHHVADYDLVHIHALFSHTSISAARAARRLGVPYIIRPLGVLNRWGMKHRRRFIKALSFRFIEQPLLRNAAAMHYTSHQEQIEAEQAGATAPAAVVPLGIDIHQFDRLPGPEVFLNRFPHAAGRPLVLFLSRLDAKKGLDQLLPAFARVHANHPDALLVIAGSGNDDYVRAMKALALQLGLESHSVWPGFLDGQEKLSAFAAATVFVLPSYSENFGIALVEALAAGVPCLTTEGVALSEDIRPQDAGIVVRPEAKELAPALDRLLGDPALRRRLASNARRLAADRFSLEAMGAALKNLYAETLGKSRSAP